MVAKSEAGIGVLSRSFSRHPLLREELSKRYANVRFNDSGATLVADELINFLAGCDRAIVALERIDGALLDAVPGVKVISKFGVGLDNVDLEAAFDRDVRVAWTGGVNRRSVAELAICLAISSLRSVVRLHSEVVSGAWRQIPGRCLSGRTVGLLGFGHVGQEVASLLRAFNCRILFHDIRDMTDRASALGAASVDLETLLGEAEILSLHVPLTPLTRNILDRDRLSRMRTDAVLINTARGGLVDEEALFVALRGGHLSAAAFDVFREEPPGNSALLSLPNFIATGHIGGSSEEAVLAMGRAAIEGLETAVDARCHIPSW